MSKKTKVKANEPKQEHKLQLATEVATREVAEFVSGTDYLPNPDTILQKMGGTIKVFREMADAHLDAVRNKRIANITARTWNIDGSKGDAKKAKAVEDWLWNLNLRNVIEQMLGANGYGYAVHEVIWGFANTDAGVLILPLAIKDRKQEWFKFGNDGELLLQTKNNTREELPPRKFIVTRNKPTSVNPYGESILSRCFWPLAFKKGGLKFWMIFVEKYGMPKALGKIPPSSTSDEQKKFLTMLSGLVRDAVAVIPQTGSVELLQTNSGTGSEIHSKLVQWADSEISKAWLGETLTTEQTSSGGTQAMATVHEKVRSDLALDDANMVEASMNQLIRWIYEINWPGEKNIPWFNIILPEDMQESRLARDRSLKELGVKFNAQYIADVYGIDPKYFDMTEELTGASFAEAQPKRKAPKQMEGEVNKFAESLESRIDKIDPLKPIEELVTNAKSLEEVRDKLLESYNKIPADKVAEELESAFMAADLAGRYEILAKAGIIDA